jgi:hypothetical protein
MKKMITTLIAVLVALMLPLTTLAQASNPAPVSLGRYAGNFVILAKTAITSTGVTHITGDVGISPNDASSMTGFGLIKDPSGTFWTSSLVTGKVYGAADVTLTPAMLTQAIGEMQTAYTNAAGRPADSTELYAGDLKGRTLTHGVYKWSGNVQVSAGSVTFSGNSTDVWILQIAGNFDLVGTVALGGGAQAKNIFFQVAGIVKLESGAAMRGVILCQTQIVMITGASLNLGIALAQTQVTLQANTIVSPGNLSAVNDNSTIPQKFALEQNYPNPFNPSTIINFSLAKSGQVKLSVYDILGREVALLVNERTEAGVHEVKFEGANLASGVYFYRLQAGDFVASKRLLLLK